MPSRPDQQGRPTIHSSRTALPSATTTRRVYVCDTGITHYPNAKNIVWQYDLNGDKLSNPRLLIDYGRWAQSGFPDGLRVDTDGQYLGRRRLGRRRL